MALIATSAGSSSGSSHLRRITMLVSSRPWAYSAGIGIVRLLLGRGVLVGPERLQRDVRRCTGHRGELRARNEPPTAAQRDQLPDLMPVARHCEGLPALDGIHDLFGAAAQVALGDLGLRWHGS